MSEFPVIKPGDNGWIVYVNSRVKLPGWYTSFNMAERALIKYQKATVNARKKG
jgi:hypothetical protein